MKLAIVGSRDLTAPQTEHVQYLTGMLCAFWELDESLAILSGGASGVDAIAKWRAEVNCLPYEEFLPEYRRWAPDGFKDRNMRLAEACGELVCIRSQQSKSYGSGWTADYAEAMGRRVWRFYV